MFIGIGAELCKQHVFFGPRRDFDPAFFPEGVELGDEIALRALAERVVEVPQPGRLVAPLGKGVLAAEAPGEIAENSEIVASLADRIDRLMHRDDKPITRRAADIVAFERGGRRQHYVGVACRRRPPRLVHDDRFRRCQARRSRFRS